MKDQILNASIKQSDYGNQGDRSFGFTVRLGSDHCWLGRAESDGSGRADLESVKAGVAELERGQLDVYQSPPGCPKDLAVIVVVSLLDREPRSRAIPDGV